jgi:hypothetical protein
MSATPPEAKAKYSRAPGDSERRRRPRPESRARIVGGVPAAVLGGGLLGAVLLIAAELAPLYSVHTATRRAALQTVTGGSHNTYALIPIALLGVVLAYGAARDGSRIALLALTVLGVLALLIALLGDLPDSQASGLIHQSGGYVTASSSPSAGLYLETLGAVVLLITCALGFLLGGPPPRPVRTSRRKLSAS